MNAAEVQALRPGDKVSWVGRVIIYEAIVAGPCNAAGELPLHLVVVLKTEEADALAVWDRYRSGQLIWEDTCVNSGFGRGWVSDGSRPDNGPTPLRFLGLDRFKRV